MSSTSLLRIVTVETLLAVPSTVTAKSLVAGLELLSSVFLVAQRQLVATFHFCVSKPWGDAIDLVAGLVGDGRVR